VLLLFLIIRYENSFDLFHNKVNQIYRVGNSFQGGGYDDVIVTPQIPLMEKEYPDIIHSSRFHGAGDIIGHDNTFVRTSYRIVDPDFGYMFDFKMISGNLKKALATPNQIVLTKATAGKLFGNEDPMGKSVYLVGEKINFTIAGIAEDLPKNSTLQFEALIPWANAPKWLDIDQAGNWYRYDIFRQRLCLFSDRLRRPLQYDKKLLKIVVHVEFETNPVTEFFLGTNDNIRLFQKCLKLLHVSSIDSPEIRLCQ
jgi:hypothetical protein